MASYIKEISRAMQRRKPIQRATGSDTKLNRCLTTFDLTALGIGSTLGLGIYVVAGQVASLKAGPAVIISFVIAAFASILAGFCYAEFGARVPAAGSAYIYSYVSVGEFMAFLIGWNLIVEYLIGTASGARGYSEYLDSLFDGQISKTYSGWVPFFIPGTSKYPDLVAALITFIITISTSIGVKDSARLNIAFTGVNLFVVFYVIIVGFFYADLGNWQLKPPSYDVNATNVSVGFDASDPEQIKLRKTMGSGGFFPFGISGVLAGAATCFYGFIGFDVIATTGEEVRNSKKSIPASIIMSLLFVLFVYLGISTVQTLIWPYWDQDKPAPLPYIFKQVGLPISRYIINIGSLAGLSTSVLGALYPLPRVLYAMSSDGLIFRAFSAVNSYTRTPLFATLFSGFWAAVMATLFDLTELADMMSIGTLLAYSLVAISVLILRYHHESITEINDMAKNHITIPDISKFGDEQEAALKETYQNNEVIISSSSSFIKHLFSTTFNTKGFTHPSISTTKTSCYLIWTLVFLLLVLDYYLIVFQTELLNQDRIPVTIAILFIIAILSLTVGLHRQPRSNQDLSFKVPFIPYVPLLSCAINFYLMFKLSTGTWIRFAIWLVLGLITYFTYSIRHSDEHLRELANDGTVLQKLKLDSNADDKDDEKPNRAIIKNK